MTLEERELGADDGQLDLVDFQADEPSPKD
jgi:hypothetical protein